MPTKPVRPVARDSSVRDGAVVLLSGGMDSATALAMAVDQFGAKRVTALSVDYGQTHRERELKAAKDLADHFLPSPTAQHVIVNLPRQLFMGGASALIPSDNVEMPHVSYKQLEMDFGVSPTYVPYRNGIMVSMATALALTREVGWVFVGVHGEDARHWAYPC